MFFWFFFFLLNDCSLLMWARSDMGQKLGQNGLDNGFMAFDHYTIPRENLLNKVCVCFLFLALFLSYLLFFFFFFFFLFFCFFFFFFYVLFQSRLLFAILWCVVYLVSDQVGVRYISLSALLSLISTPPVFSFIHILSRRTAYY